MPAEPQPPRPEYVEISWPAALKPKHRKLNPTSRPTQFESEGLVTVPDPIPDEISFTFHFPRLLTDASHLKTDLSAVTGSEPSTYRIRQLSLELHPSPSGLAGGRILEVRASGFRELLTGERSQRVFVDLTITQLPEVPGPQTARILAQVRLPISAPPGDFRVQQWTPGDFKKAGGILPEGTSTLRTQATALSLVSVIQIENPSHRNVDLQFSARPKAALAVRYRLRMPVEDPITCTTSIVERSFEEKWESANYYLLPLSEELPRQWVGFVNDAGASMNSVPVEASRLRLFGLYIDPASGTNGIYSHPTWLPSGPYAALSSCQVECAPDSSLDDKCKKRIRITRQSVTAGVEASALMLTLDSTKGPQYAVRFSPVVPAENDSAWQPRSLLPNQAVVGSESLPETTRPDDRTYPDFSEYTDLGSSDDLLARARARLRSKTTTPEDEAVIGATRLFADTAALARVEGNDDILYDALLGLAQAYRWNASRYLAAKNSKAAQTWGLWALELAQEMDDLSKTRLGGKQFADTLYLRAALLKEYTETFPSRYGGCNLLVNVQEIKTLAEAAQRLLTHEGDPGALIDGMGPNRLLAWFELGNESCGVGSLAKARALLQSPLSRAPDFAANHVLFALAQERKDTQCRILSALVENDPETFNPERPAETRAEFQEAREILRDRCGN